MKKVNKISKKTKLSKLNNKLVESTLGCQTNLVPVTGLSLR